MSDITPETADACLDDFSPEEKEVNEILVAAREVAEREVGACMYDEDYPRQLVDSWEFRFGQTIKSEDHLHAMLDLGDLMIIFGRSIREQVYTQEGLKQADDIAKKYGANVGVWHAIEPDTWQPAPGYTWIFIGITAAIGLVCYLAWRVW